MWSDNETTLDLLNVQHLVTTVIDILDSPGLLPVTIGVYGDWGSGKSSIARMIEGRLRGDDELVIYFNGWRFEGYEDARAALMSTILDEIARKRTLGPKAVALVKRLAARIDWFRVGRTLLHLKLAALTAGATAPASIAAEVALEKPDKSLKNASGAEAGEKGGDDDDEDTEDDLELDELLKKAGATGRTMHRTVRQFEKDFAKLLKETKLRRLVVVIDDLDRCLPDRVIETLEAIRLFLAVPGTAFILTADEALVRRAIVHHFPPLAGVDPAAPVRERASLDLGANYLEKMVQIPLRIPPLGVGDVENYVYLLFAQLHVEDEKFRALCTKVCGPGPQFDQVVFSPTTAEALLGELPRKELVDDLALAAVIADVLARSVDGNPRRVKRFLNALLIRLKLAKARGLSLDRRIAAKLLLLEYFRDETWFHALNQWQAHQDGTSRELAELEQRARAQNELPRAADAVAAAEADDKHSDGAARESAPTEDERPAARGRARGAAGRASAERGAARDGGDGADERLGAAVGLAMPQLSAEAELWLADEWVLRWLRTDPPLAGVDLRPYFYLAQQRITVALSPEQRLGRPAREVFDLLLAKTQLERDRGAGAAAALGLNEQSALFSALAHYARRTEPSEAEDTPLLALFRLTKAIPALAPQLVAFLGSLPAARIRPGLTIRLVEVIRNTAAVQAGRELLARWAGMREVPALASTASSAMARLVGGTSLGAPGGSAPPGRLR